MSTITASDYRPPRWLHSPHLQSVLSSSALRRTRGARRFAATGAVTDEHWLHTPEGVRLQGFHSRPAVADDGSLAILLHGWEGSANSSYVLNAAASLLEAGCAVFRLNFRDHGDTHHANEGIFHSCRLREVIEAALLVQARFRPRRLVAAGFSLGGNFALRLARSAPEAGLDLAHAAAVCPVIDPAAGMAALERAPGFYEWYFMRKWRASLRRKRELFPQAHGYDDSALQRGMRELTAWLVGRHGEFDSLEDYFRGYALAGDGLADVRVPISILTAADDPVIPVAGFHHLRLPAHGYLEIAEHGGHCAFIENAALTGYGERWVCRRLLAPEPHGAAATMTDSVAVSSP